MSKDTEYPVISGINEDVVSASLLYFHNVNDKITEKMTELQTYNLKLSFL